MTTFFKILSAGLGGLSIIGLIVIHFLTKQASRLKETVEDLETDNAAKDKAISILKTAQSFITASKERQDEIAKEGKEYADKIHSGDIDIDDLFDAFNDGV